VEGGSRSTHPHHSVQIVGVAVTGGTTCPGRLGTVYAPSAGTGCATHTARRTPTSCARRPAPVVGTVFFPLSFSRHHPAL